MYKAIRLTLVWALAAAFLSGCWNRRELNEIAVTTTIGLDRLNDGNILLSDQLLYAPAISPIGGGGGGDRAPVTLLSETGEGIQLAARKMTMKVSKKIYVGQLQILVLGEKLARSGVADVLDHIARDHEYRRDFFVIVAKGMTANEVLRIFTPLESIPANKLRDSLDSSSKAWGASGAIQIGEFLSALTAKGQDPVLSGVTIQGNPEEGSEKESVARIQVRSELAYTGYAVFKKDRLLGWLNQRESKGVNYVRGKIKSTSVSVPCPEGKHTITVELLNTKAKMKPKLVNGEPAVNVKISAEASIADAQCNIDMSNPATINAIEKLVNEEIRDTVKDAVKTAQTDYKADIFGFGSAFARSKPKYWSGVEKKWSEAFPEIRVQVSVSTKIREIFKTKRSLIRQMRE
ncbi:Ger(x)C family spore germination protein [Cohnella sp. CFH 77786]|uniref:Ger(x)C family spore germination protein n=1 Tax=Cohnella sp. CFH 77786 TaxID=2662265 RepID=UPI001C609535|nr:Ger(x)C family spore germination protein [Cohnella sp. CFH 77786]MBW5447957.1 Ger(x)C family spore germination protein [Cohnella sp. CFH 77786]